MGRTNPSSSSKAAPKRQSPKLKEPSQVKKEVVEPNVEPAVKSECSAFQTQVMPDNEL